MKSQMLLLAMAFTLVGCAGNRGGTTTEYGTETGAATSGPPEIGSDFDRGEQWRVPGPLSDFNDPLPEPPPYGSLDSMPPATEEE